MPIESSAWNLLDILTPAIFLHADLESRICYQGRDISIHGKLPGAPLITNVGINIPGHVGGGA